MSEVIGEAFVEIRPIAERFEGEARQQVNAAMAQLQSGTGTGVPIGPRLAPSFRAEAQAQIERATAGIRSAATVDPRLAPSFRAVTQAEVARATANIRTVARIDPLVAPSFRTVSRQEVAQAAVGLTAPATITPRLDPSFRQQAQAQLDSASAGLTEPQRFFASQQTHRELGLARSAAETEALRAAFKQLELTGVASATNIAAAASRVRAELVATGAAATEAGAAQVAAARTAAAAQAQQAATLAAASRAGLASQGVAAQVANLATLKDAGLLTASAADVVRDNIVGLESAIAGLGAARVGAGRTQLAQIDAELGRLNPELQAAKANFASIVAPVEQVTAKTAQAAKEAGIFGSRSVLASSASAAGLQSVALRYGLIGLAATTAFQAVGQAADALDQTGREAFTTEGRIRNLTSALIRQDLIGAFNGLTAVPKTIEEAGISIREASGHVEAFQRVIAGSQVDRSKEGLQAFDDAAREAGTSSRRLAQEVLDSIPAFAALDSATKTALNSVLALKDAQGRPIVGGFSGQQPGFQLPQQTFPERLRAGGFPAAPRTQVDVLGEREQVAARQGQLRDELAAAQELAAIARRRVQIVKAGGPLLEERRKAEQDQLDNVARIQNQIRSDADSLRAGTVSANLAVAQASGDLREVLRQRQAEAARIAAQLAAFKGPGAQRQVLVNAQKQAQADVTNAQNAITTAAQQAASDAAANRKRQLDAAAQELRDDIALRKGKLEIALANAANADNIRKQREALQALIRLDLEKAKDTRLDPLERQGFRADVPQRRAQLADLGAGGGSAEVQRARLDNLAAAAERTPDPGDNRQAFDAWIAFWQSQIRSAGDLERVQIQGRIAALRFDRRNLGDGSALAEQRLANRRARAELTKGIGDNRDAINASIAYWKEQKEGATALRKAQIESTLIGLRGDLKGLSEPEATGQGTTAFDLLTDAAKSFSEHAGNLISGDQPFAGPTDFTADLAQFLKRSSTPFGSGAKQNAMTDPELIRALHELTLTLRDGRRDSKKTPAKTPATRSGGVARNDMRFREADQARANTGAIG